MSPKIGYNPTNELRLLFLLQLGFTDKYTS